MGKRTEHLGRCPICNNVVKELVFDKRDMALKCDNCYSKKGKA